MKKPSSEMSTADYICIECGHHATELYKKFPGGIIKIAHCDKCQNVTDKYIEFDSVVILLDALLHKPQAYRHMLFNTNLQWHWKLLIILLLCDAYLRWQHLHTHQPQEATGDHSSSLFYAALEWDFYKMFIMAAIEWIVLGSALLLLLMIRTKFQKNVTPDKEQNNSTLCILRGLIMSSFGKLFVIPATIWGQSHSAICLMLTQVFIFTSNVVALKVVCNVSRVGVMMVLSVSRLLEYMAGQWLDTL